MKLKIIIGLSVCLTAVTALALTEPSVIPLPQSLKAQAGTFHLSPGTKIFAGFGSTQTADQLAAALRPSTGYRLPVRLKFLSGTPPRNGIWLTTKNADAHLGPEGYELTIAKNSIILRAPAQAGLFYGVQTLLQLLPPEIFSSNVVRSADWQVPCVQIQDRPRFQWRGLMLDVSRHFFTKLEVEQLLDAMALHKLNTFHWHLTDDNGWRIEIKKYPKLTSVGAWRSGIEHGLDPKSSTAYGPDGRYGGFYTQADIREVVAYAAKLHITVVPEIEMPGHSGAALRAYPEFGCAGAPGSNVYSPARDGTFQFLDDVLAEVFQLFPGKYIHIGGDEVSPGPWQKDAACQALMKREGLKTPAQLESWFIRRIEKFVNARGKTLIGWSEIAHGGLAQNAVVMDWIGGGKEAATDGHDVVMTPTGYCYFDYYQSQDHATEPRAIGGFLPLSKAYSFEPVPEGLAPEFQSHILGGQGNVWTEYIANLKHVEYMAFPRLCALAEVTWSPKDARNFEDFKERLKVDEQRLDELGVNYRRDVPAAATQTGSRTPAPNAK